MDRCIIVTNGSFAAMTTANSILQAVLRAADGRIPVQLLVNNASSAGTREEVACYAQRANIEILGTVDHAKELKHSSLAGRTIFADLPGSAMAACFDQLADNLLAPAYPSRPVPFGRQSRCTGCGLAAPGAGTPAGGKPCMISSFGAAGWWTYTPAPAALPIWL